MKKSCILQENRSTTCQKLGGFELVFPEKTAFFYVKTARNEHYRALHRLLQSCFAFFSLAENVSEGAASRGGSDG